jgi:hypothetical protein
LFCAVVGKTEAVHPHVPSPASTLPAAGRVAKENRKRVVEDEPDETYMNKAKKKKSSKKAGDADRNEPTGAIK